MSYREDKLMSLAGADINQLTESELKTYCKELLKNKIHGICFSVYDENQKPGDDISDEQILKKLEIIKPHVKWIRTFSCSDENMRIPILAKELGFKTLVGAWLGKDLDKNQIEVDKLIELCNDGYIDVAAVGNEVMYRKDLLEEKLIEYIKYVKSKIKTEMNEYMPMLYEVLKQGRQYYLEMKRDRVLNEVFGARLVVEKEVARKLGYEIKRVFSRV